jgi:uncharacterized protein
MKINVKVTTKASRKEIVQIDDDNFKIKITKVPEKGKANDEVIKMLAKYFGVAKSKVKIVRGTTSSQKVIEIENG